jgi:hypothetical protein
MTMKRATYSALIIMACLLYSFSVFSASSTQTKKSTSTITSKATTSTGTANQKIGKTTIKKKELPIEISLEKRGKALHVKVSRVPLKIDLYSYKVRLHTFMGRGKIRFDITPYLQKVKKKSITIFAYGSRGTKYQKTFNLSKYISMMQKKKGPMGKIVTKVPLKSKKPPGFIKPKGAGGSINSMRSDRVIPGGIRILSPSSGDIVERGRTIVMSYQLVRGFDHFPEEIVFSLKQFRSSTSREVLKAIRSGSGEDGTDLSAVRFVDIQLPYGMIDDRRYVITAESSRPMQTGMSSVFIASTPENSIDVHAPGADGRFPPGMGINIPVGYSFNTGTTPSNVTIQIVRERGGFSMELYSGPHMASHSFVRPSATDSWPASLGDEYRIVVTSDDGRIGSSQKFSLAPYRFDIIEPDGGEAYHTAYSPWWFRWHAEGSIDFVQAVLLRGGREMYRWRPHVSPPEHLMGDELGISPEQLWHPAGTDYKLRIEGYTGDPGVGAVLVAVDESEGSFEVVDDYTAPVSSYASCTERIPISIVSPAHTGSTITWRNNSEYTLTWCTYDESVRSVDLTLVNASTGERWGIRMGVPNRFESLLFPGDRGYNGGSMDWTVPDTLAQGYYNIHIQSTDRSYENTTFYGISIANWVAKGVSPIRSVVWAAGETRTIEWESGGLSDQTVDIFLRHWDSRREYQVADNVPNTGRFSWRILSETLPEGIDRWENVYFKIIIGRHRADSEFFTISR